MTPFTSARLDRTRFSLEIHFLNVHSPFPSKCDTPFARRIASSVVVAENRQSSI